MSHNYRAYSILESSGITMKGFDDRGQAGVSRLSWARVACLVLVTCMCGCPCENPDDCPAPPDTDDMTPPGFLAIQAEYIRVSDGLSTGTEAIPAGGFIRAGLLPTD